MTTEVRYTLQSCELVWDENGLPKGVSGKEYIHTIVDGERVALTLTPLKNLLKLDVSLQDFLTEYQAQLITTSAVLKDERDTLKTEAEQHETEKSQLQEQIELIQQKLDEARAHNNALQAEIDALTSAQAL